MALLRLEDVLALRRQQVRQRGVDVFPVARDDL